MTPTRYKGNDLGAALAFLESAGAPRSLYHARRLIDLRISEYARGKHDAVETLRRVVEGKRGSA